MKTLFARLTAAGLAAIRLDHSTTPRVQVTERGPRVKLLSPGAIRAAIDVIIAKARAVRPYIVVPAALLAVLGLQPLTADKCHSGQEAKPQAAVTTHSAGLNATASVTSKVLCPRARRRVCTSSYPADMARISCYGVR